MELMILLIAFKYWFSASSTTGWGYRSFIPSVELTDASKGFIVKDTLTIQVQILVLSVFKALR